MKFSVKARILAIAVIPSLLLTSIMLVMGIMFMKTGMEDEILKGLMSSAYTYKDIAEHLVDREPGDNETETVLKQNSGYDFTWFDGDTRKNSSLGDSVIGTKAADTVIKAVINGGQTFTSTNTQVAGKPYFVAYVPVKDDSGKVVAMAFTGVSRESVTAQITKSIAMMLGIAAVLIIIAILVAFKAASGMAGAIGVMKQSINHLADGEFVKVEETKYLNRKDEIGDALGSTNVLVDKLSGIVTDIRESANKVDTSSKSLSDMAEQISQTAGDVANAVQEIASGATQQADEIQTVTENVANLSEAISTVSDNAETLKDTASEMNSASRESADTLQDLLNCMQKMSDSVDSIAKTMDETNNAVKAVNEKVEGIDAIATQTNLLSLNASIEAARAGEAGKGFSVVAEEIGKLAKDSSDMAHDIKEQMDQLLTHATDAAHRTKDMESISDEIRTMITNTADTLNTLIDNVQSTVSGIDNISDNTVRCDSSKSQIVDSISGLSAISEENAASSQETGASMEELSATVTTLAGSANELKEIAEVLNTGLSFFK